MAPEVELAGDASTRRFYRVSRGNGTAVSMRYGHALDAGGDAFLAVAGYLRRLGLPVPEVLEVRREEGTILLEDLGDVMLEDACREERPERRALYEEAIDLLVTLQAGGRERPDPACPAFHILHDEAKLLFELRFFREHFLEGLRGWRDEAQGAELEQLLGELAARVAAYPRALCHRDYHSRNLMVGEDAPPGRRLRLIDFQDARMGPRLYDVASLLFDSYVTLDPADIELLFGRFAGSEAAAWRDELRMTAAQRNLKALGTFGYQVHVRGKERYRDAIPRTLEHLRAGLGEEGIGGALRARLLPFLPELGADRPPSSLV